MQMLTFANEKSMETICSFIAAWNLNLVERYDVTAVLEGISKYCIVFTFLAPLFIHILQ